MSTAGVLDDNGFQLHIDIDKKYYGSYLKNIFPIHPLPNTIKEKLKENTHHYCGIFTKTLLAPLPNKIYVNNVAYKVDKNRRILIVSYDGKLNLWQNAPSFQSEENYLAGTPILDVAGNIVSIVIVNKNRRYAISCFDGYSGKLETNRPWLFIKGTNGIIYGNRTFANREELSNYLKDKKFGNHFDLQAIVVDSNIPRIILFDLVSGLELSHNYIRGEFDTVICEKYH